MKKRLVSIIGIVFMVGLVLIVGVANNQDKSLTKKEQQLLAETPLTEYSYWYSLERYPKYKLEAAERVEQLMAEGTSKDEACQEAIDETSDKIFEDTTMFIENSKDIPEEEREEAYYEFIEQTQK